MFLNPVTLLGVIFRNDSQNDLYLKSINYNNWYSRESVIVYQLSDIFDIQIR